MTFIGTFGIALFSFLAGIVVADMTRPREPRLRLSRRIK